MQLTRSGEYALRGLIFLAKHPADRMSLVSEISKVQNIPATCLAKIFQRLSKVGLLRSIRGLNGGFALARPAQKITMREVIEALEGRIALNRCHLKEGECNEEKGYSLHQVLGEAQERLLDILNRTTMEDLCKPRVQNERKRRR